MFCICRRAANAGESNPKSGGSQLAILCHNELYGFIDCDGAKVPAWKTLGVITAAFLKDANDPAWRTNKHQRRQAFVDKYNQAGGKDDSAAVSSVTRPPRHWPKMLKQCGQ